MEKFLQKLKTELSYDPAIPLLGINLKKKTNPTTQKDACTPVNTVSLSTTARTRKQPKCLSTDKCIKKLW